MVDMFEAVVSAGVLLDYIHSGVCLKSDWPSQVPPHYPKV